jgi:oligopeptide transport system permease protein
MMEGEAPEESGSTRRLLRHGLGSLRPSAFLLGLVAFACIVGPLLSPHTHDRVYRDYVLAPPSVTAHPTAAEIKDALEGLTRRMRLALESTTGQGGTLHVGLASDAPIDPRTLRAFEGSDVFASPRVIGTSDDGRRLEIALAVKPATFFFGTDVNGRDLLTRILVAGRVSLAVGLLASLVALVIGIAYGAIAGYAGGRTDHVMMRLVEILYALPFVFFVIVLTMIFGRSLLLILVVIGAVEWLDMARIVRGETLAIKARDYVQAAAALGATTPAILCRHIVPNAAGPILAFLALLVPRVILVESFLSFLGLGVQEPMTSWGVLIADGARNIQSAPSLLIFPALFLGVTLGALQLLGRGLREALDPTSA